MIPVHFLMNNSGVEGREELPLLIDVCMGLVQVYFDKNALIRTELLCLKLILLLPTMLTLTST